MGQPRQNFFGTCGARNNRIGLIRMRSSLRERSSHEWTRQDLLPRFLAVGALDVGMYNFADPTLNRYRVLPLAVRTNQFN